MKKVMTICVLSVLSWLPLFPQQEIYLTLKEGVPAIAMALPSFFVSGSSPQAKEAAAEIHKVISEDLAYSRIFEHSK